MKRILLTTASAVALGMAAPALAQVPDATRGQSESWIDQINTNNSATVRQSASVTTGNVSDINQGNFNSANVDQSGSNTLNKSIIDQAEYNSSTNLLTGGVEGANVVQRGDFNNNLSTITQKTTSSTAGLGDNTADVLQEGVNNINTSGIIQDGFANAVVVWQGGEDIRNTSTVNQTGSENSAHVIQSSGPSGP
jgi:hypothetical protein